MMCSTKFVISLLLVSAVPIGIIVSLERAPAAGHVYHYHGVGWFRETAKWDPLNRRFLVSRFEGGVGEVTLDRRHRDGVLDEITAVEDADLAGNASLGICIDHPRNRLLVVEADLITNRYSGLAAYDLSSWQRLFLTHLATPQGDEKTFADDVAVDEAGNAYVTDAKGSKIWKVSVEGRLLSTIKSPLFTPKEWYKNLVALNGIVYHPDGYLLVIHTFTGNLYKIHLNHKGEPEEHVKLVKLLTGSLQFGDGMELLSRTKLAVAGNPSGRLVETSDGWETASVVAKFWGPMHRLATSATVKDGKVYLSHAIGLGYPKKKHAIIEAVFSYN